MAVFTSQIHLNTKGNTDIIDLTGRIQEAVKSSKLKEGLLTVSVIGSTAAVTTIEYEPALTGDLKDFFERLIPSDRGYAHDATWGDANGHSHLRASLLGASLSIPISDGKACLGTWQQIILVDFDNRPRSRELVLQFIG